MALTKVIGAGLGAVTQDGAATFNEGSADVDFRIESNGNTHGIFLDGGNEKVGIFTSNPNDYYADDLVLTAADEGGITIKGGTGHANFVAFADGTSGNAAYRGFLNYDHAIDSLYLGVAGESHFTINSAHILTMDKQPAFNAKGSSTPTLAINTYYTLPIDTEIFDQNADYNTSNYTFTAPVTGRYQLNGSVYFYNYLDSSAGYMILIIKTSNREYQKIITATMFGSDIANYSMNISTLADMDANDTAYLNVYQQGGAAQTTISGGNTHFTGYLVA